MTRLILFCVFTCATFLANSQTSTKQFDFDGSTRTYIEHVPSTYNENSPVPLVLSLHGMGGSASSFQINGLKEIADTANFIVVFPEALTNPNVNATFWNSGLDPTYTTDDVGFISNLIDTIKANYNIADQKVFISGMSSGGFMCQRLACEIAEKVDAMVSIEGTIAKATKNSCTPSRTIPMCHLHGTADTVVPWEGNVNNITSVDEMKSFWLAQQNCNASDSIITYFPDDVNDGYTVESYLFDNCSGTNKFLLYKLNNAGHIWMYHPQNDIDFSIETWKFFYSINNLPNGIPVINFHNPELTMFPNPARDHIKIISNSFKIIGVKIYNQLGALEFSTSIDNYYGKIDLNKLNSGYYFIKATTNLKTHFTPIIILK